MAGSNISTLTTGLTSGQKAAYYKDEFLSHYEEHIQLQKFAQRVPLPTNEGKVVDFFRYHPFDLVTTATAEDTLSISMNELTGMNITATLKLFTFGTQWSELFQRTHRDTDLKASVSALLGQNAAESLDWQLTKHIGESGHFAIRCDGYLTADLDTTAHTSATAARIVFEAANVGTSADFWNGGTVTVWRGSSYGEAEKIDDSETTSVGDFTRIDIDTDAGDMTVHLCHPAPGQNTATAISSSTHNLGNAYVHSQYLNVKALLRASVLLDKHRAIPFDDGDYRCILSHGQYLKLMEDTTWTTMNSETMRTGIEEGEVGRIGKMRLLITTMPYSASTIGTTSTDPLTIGTYEMAMCFGKDAFGCVDLSTSGGAFEPKFLWKDPNTPDSGDQAGLEGFATWKAYFTYRSLNANHVIGIWCLTP